MSGVLVLTLVQRLGPPFVGPASVPAAGAPFEGRLLAGSVQANIEYLYIRSYGQTASVTSNLWVYSRT